MESLLELGLKGKLEEVMSETIVIYHGSCFDGITAAWVAQTYFRSRSIPVDFFAATYGENPPDVKDKSIFIVDFSYPRAILEKMALEAKDITVLDHHKTAEEDLKGLAFAIFDMNRSGAGIAWDWFFPGHPRHWLVNTVEDRDLWRFAHPNTKALMGYIATIPMDLYNWNLLAQSNQSEIHVLGIAINKYITNYGLKAIEHVRHEMVGGYLVPTMNLSYQNCSDHLDALIKVKPDVFFVASYFRRGDGLWQFSLRSHGEFDVSVIAKQYGGGGHKNAAGFTLRILPW